MALHDSPDPNIDLSIIRLVYCGLRFLPNSSDAWKSSSM